MVKLTSSELASIEDRTDWDRVESLTDADIDRAISEDSDAAPVLDDAFWRNAQILDPDHEKTVITIRVDDDVLEFFKAGGSGYQTRMNAVLRAYAYARREGLPGDRRFLAPIADTQAGRRRGEGVRLEEVEDG